MVHDSRQLAPKPTVRMASAADPLGCCQYIFPKGILVIEDMRLQRPAGPAAPAAAHAQQEREGERREPEREVVHE